MQGLGRGGRCEEQSPDTAGTQVGRCPCSPVPLPSPCQHPPCSRLRHAAPALPRDPSSVLGQVLGSVGTDVPNPGLPALVWGCPARPGASLPHPWVPTAAVHGGCRVPTWGCRVRTWGCRVRTRAHAAQGGSRVPEAAGLRLRHCSWPGRGAHQHVPGRDRGDMAGAQGDRGARGWPQDTCAWQLPALLAGTHHLSPPVQCPALP